MFYISLKVIIYTNESSLTKRPEIIIYIFNFKHKDKIYTEVYDIMSRKTKRNPIGSQHFPKAQCTCKFAAFIYFLSVINYF